MIKNDPQKSIFRQESLERLSSPEQLDQLMQVVNSRSWLSLAALAALVGLAIAWSILGRIPIIITSKGVLVYPTQSSDQLISVSYWVGEASDRIQPGMAVMIVPDRFQAEAVGGIWGRVKTVSAAPVTTLDAARRATNTAVQPTATEIIAELEPDTATASGYRWSSAAGQRVELSPGMTTTVRITIAQKAPITFALPFLETTP